MKIFMLMALGLIPSLSFAATYHYVTTDGYTATVEADSAAEALVKAPNIAANSGVALDMGIIESGEKVEAVADTSTGAQAGLYHFVNVFGLTDSVMAPNGETALVIAPNIAANSGVAVDTGHIEEGQVVESVAK